MNRLDLMLDRLPPTWRVEPPDASGVGASLLWQILRLVSNHLEVFDEDMDRVQRSHWIDTAFDRLDLEKLGALFEIPAAAWEPDELYRQRLKVTVAARLEGAVTGETLVWVMRRLLEAADAALLTSPVFARGAGPKPRRARLIEFPSVRVRPKVLRDRKGLLRPLDKVTLTHRGLASSPLEGVIYGVAGERTSLPTLINLSTGQVLCYLGRVPAGAALRLRFTGVGSSLVARAELDGADVSDRLVGGSGYGAGATLPLEPEQPARPLMLERGDNQLWFVPLGVFDQPGFDGSVFSNPDPLVRQARFAGGGVEGGIGDSAESGRWDQALFFQEPAVALDLWWDEQRPARFDVELAGVGQRREAGRRARPEADEQRLLALLDQTLTLLRAAGVQDQLRTQALTELARSSDRLIVLRPDAGLETNPQEAELAALGALFDFTAKDGARFE